MKRETFFFVIPFMFVFAFILGFIAGIFYGREMGISECPGGKPATDLSVLTPGRTYKIRPLNEIPDMSWVVENKEGGERWVLALPIAEGSYKVFVRDGKNQLETTLE